MAGVIETHCENCGSDEGVLLRDHGEWFCEHCATVFSDHERDHQEAALLAKESSHD